MKHIFSILAVLALALAAPAVMQGQASKAEQEIRRVEDEIIQAHLKADVAKLDKCYADEFTVIRPNGAVTGKAELLEAIRGGKIKDYSIEESDPKIRVYGDTAVMTTVEKTTGEQFGMPSSGLFRNGMAYAKRGGKWVAVLHQMSPIVTPPQPNAAPGK